MGTYIIALNPPAAYEPGEPPPMYPEDVDPAIYAALAGVSRPRPDLQARPVLVAPAAQPFGAFLSSLLLLIGPGPHTARIASSQAVQTVMTQAGAMTAGAALIAAGFNVEVT